MVFISGVIIIHISTRNLELKLRHQIIFVFLKHSFIQNHSQMKYLKYFLYIIIGLIVLFLAVGLLKSSVSYGHEITVDKSLKEAWAVTQDASKYDQWLEGFKSIELISGKQGEVGSKYKVIVNPGEGQEDFEMIETVVAIDKYKLVELGFDSDMMDFEQKMLFSEADGKVKFKTESTVKGKGIMMRSMFALMEMFGGAFSKQEAKNIEALKKVINENTTDYYPAPVVEENEAEIQE
jgi:hypothetical protein